MKKKLANLLFMVTVALQATAQIKKQSSCTLHIQG